MFVLTVVLSVIVVANASGFGSLTPNATRTKSQNIDLLGVSPILAVGNDEHRRHASCLQEQLQQPHRDAKLNHPIQQFQKPQLQHPQQRIEQPKQEQEKQFHELQLQQMQRRLERLEQIQQERKKQQQLQKQQQEQQQQQQQQPLPPPQIQSLKQEGFDFSIFAQSLPSLYSFFLKIKMEIGMTMRLSRFKCLGRWVVHSKDAVTNFFATPGLLLRFFQRGIHGVVTCGTGG
jgi:hypothetical protein